jgi:hypothetical protein
MAWLKYADAPILVDELFNRDQPEQVNSYLKPRGFWITDDSEDCWRSWCLSNRFSLDRLVYKHAIDLDEARILILRDEYEVRRFTRTYRVFKKWGPDHDPHKWTDTCIYWPNVAKDYAGIIITPYQWSLRMEAGFDWYYGWDCASGCIWDASAIKDVHLIEIDRDVVMTALDSEAA